MTGGPACTGSVSPPDPLALLVAVLACYRLSLLVTADEIARPWRDRALEKLGDDSRLGYLIDCPWCASVWLAPPIVASALAWADGWGWWLAAGSLAASAVTGALASYASP